MENMKRMVSQIAYTHCRDFSNLPSLQRSLIPFLSFTSSLYRFLLSIRHQLYQLGFFRKHRLPVPVVSVGNLTWGGNGKTPMVEFISLCFAQAGISPLILTRGYGGGDEAKMLQRHLLQTPAKIGVGANRVRTAAWFFKRYGYTNPRSSGRAVFPQEHSTAYGDEVDMSFDSDKIGAVILDDGMQHWSLERDLEILMVNGMMPWGNGHLVPLGPLREPLTEINRADVAVVHHADMVSDKDLKDLVLMMQEIKENLPIYFTRLAPSHFFEVKNRYSKHPIEVVCGMVVLCVSAIGFANAFIQAIAKMGPLYVDRLDFNDHHLFEAKDTLMIRERLKKLQDEFDTKPIVVMTEKDYDRDPKFLKELAPFEVLVLCSQLHIVSSLVHTEKNFKKLLKRLLETNSV
ncbi:probable tetraacyldisaccharide 4'-kinase, mitochondrial isoform X2 [Macadamia integrifolia]|uniref:probable tetraacyldisaccharide 4'-kinase, mitochondrial isoform X2 n=1 Tax=Macadamia integrifolia TaxID=60698 RepID=UPI001C533164|nr:probable tetraacyldisaccharide 4'-kinase, mitochondrial isoform X2 [Macadamia integrifolia]XP_042518825.1 probable tetraacyldisaccharide 4'-kinase, mitochondrial isoform X2 [Macadamia integrifolia]